MKALVTGGTGLVGNDLVGLLLARGHEVRAVVRDLERARPLFPSSVELVKGDVEDLDSMRDAAKGVDWFFHVAGVPDSWQRDPSIFDRVNRQGTVNALHAAEEAGVRRFIHTSSMSVFSAKAGGVLRETNEQGRKATHYERSKQAAEREVDAARARGLDAVILNPGGVYGPSPLHLSLNTLILSCARGIVAPAPPGGVSVIFVRGCSEAHLAAAERGRSGERYLLADQHCSMKEISEEVLRQVGSPRNVRVLPKWLLTSLATAVETVSRPFGKKPLLTADQLSYLFWDVRIDSSKAQRELGFRPTSLAEGVEKTLRCFVEQGLLVEERSLPQGAAS